MGQAQTVRTLSLIGADGAGKTALAEALLRFADPKHAHPSGSTARLDAEPEEKKRNFSLGIHPLSFESVGRAFHLLDCPGFSSFLPDVERALHVTDGAVFVVSAATGAHHAAERLYDAVATSGRPCIAVLSRLDHERADFDRALADIESSLKVRPVPIHLPIRGGGAVWGIVDLIEMKAHIAKGDFGRFDVKPIPADLVDAATMARALLLEAAAECEDDLIEAYLEAGTLEPDQIRRGLASGAAKGVVLPVACVAARAGVGIAELLEVLVSLLPAPRPVVGMVGDKEASRVPDGTGAVVAQVFRTVIDHFLGRVNFLRVYAGTLRPDTAAVNARTGSEVKIAHLYRSDGGQLQEIPSAGPGEIVVVQKAKDLATGDTLSGGAEPLLLRDIPPPSRRTAAAISSRAPDEKIAVALHKLVEEDPSLQVVREGGETLLWGMGQAHLDLSVERMKRKHGIDLVLSPPHPAFCETITRSAKAQGRHKKQTGGHGQFADCQIELSPLPRGGGFEFEDAIVGGAIPRQWIPSVDKGIRNSLAHGPLAGFPVVDVKARLFFGSYHDVDSSDMAFQLAGAIAFRHAVREAAPVLLEPILRLEIVVPEDAIGSVLGNLSGRRGRVSGYEPLARGTMVRALVPHVEVMRYDVDLHSLTAGVGTFTMAFDHYEPAPPEVAHAVIERRRAEGKIRGGDDE